MEKVVSADGTAIAYERLGDGPPVILVGAALCDRTATRPLAEALARHRTVLNYDRRGRGDSGDNQPYAVQREIEDLAALIGQAGGAASVYGHSSGAALALHAAAHGLPITKLILHEPPFSPISHDDGHHHRQAAEERAAGEQVEAIKSLLAQGRRAEAISSFLAPTGMPQQVIDQMSHDPVTQAVAHTLPHDPFDVVSAKSRGGATPVEQASTVRVPTLLLCGGGTFDWMIETARQLAEAVPDGHLHVMPDQGHFASPQAITLALQNFFASQ
ncbi:alpha/beta hydrolase [Actinomadura sp. KC06]|uniref:alpha/beta fold hydrolase n=1 Tax=Actinomadura sp. KC06 TaxID=2530369 RepID=UPI00104A5F31|nr:alpha/beta hydrolase [Actinomadura sp. KC06]TDD28236.1 alpha/beta hydrolase [Actinomadura sp. KC06]